MAEKKNAIRKHFHAFQRSHLNTLKHRFQESPLAPFSQIGRNWFYITTMLDQSKHHTYWHPQQSFFYILY